MKKGVEVLFIGLPCQVAGLKATLGKEYKNLLTIDLICHGVTPTVYLQQHIKNIEKQVRSVADKILFRDPQYCTDEYNFTLYGKEKLIYRTHGLGMDLYQHGYHGALNYRENCYTCKYAQRNRIGDITLGDFSGLGKEVPIDFLTKSTNCVLVNTVKGQNAIQKISDRIELIPRPFNEAFKYEPQLNHPYEKPRNRDQFLSEYIKTKDYDIAAGIVLKDTLSVYYNQHYSFTAYVKKIVRLFKRIIKKCLKYLSIR